MKQEMRHEVSQKNWVPMNLTYVSSVGELMRSGTVGSRKDNASAGACGISQRRSGGSGVAC